MAKLTRFQERCLIENAILTQQISRLQYDDNDTNPQVKAITRFLDGEIATLKAVSQLLRGDDTQIRLMSNGK